MWTDITPLQTIAPCLMHLIIIAHGITVLQAKTVLPVHRETRIAARRTRWVCEMQFISRIVRRFLVEA